MTFTSLNAARLCLGIVSVAAIVTSCAATPEQSASSIQPPSTQPAPTPPSTVPSIPPFSSSGNADMDRWRDDYATRALSDGRDPIIVYETLADIRPLALYLSADESAKGTDVSDQAEFAKPIWDYVESAVTSSRTTRGAQKLAELQTTFDQIEAQYGVDRNALTAIWAMETNLGSYIGEFDAANTLSNMAVEGRRKSFAEQELDALITLQERGIVRRDQLVSGWAGAMGQTQFMPTTFLAYAVDGDGDGRKDLWNSEADALASAANYLSVSGYQTDIPWGLEVLAPADFDWSLADGRSRQIGTWRARGLSPMRGNSPSVSDTTPAELWLPAGATGPKYLLFQNFDVFKTYNRSDSYAFSVGLLTDGVGGAAGPVTPWPTELKLLSKQDIKLLQTNLNRLGFDAGPIDGIAGRSTKGALRRFQAANNIRPADGFPTQQALAQLLSAAG
ncbi:MAG: lytic murein transglycosylase [Pseudomonadota bacterium]